MLRIYRKRAFTLMEVILSIALIGIISTMISMRGREIFAFYQQQSNIQAVMHEIELTEQVAMLYNTDIDLCIEPRGKGLVLRRTYFDQLLSLDAFLQREVSVDSVALFDEEHIKIEEKFVLKFSRFGMDGNVCIFLSHPLITEDFIEFSHTALKKK